MPPRALVTGATGCIGANVAAALLARGYDVRVMRRITSSLDALDGLKRVHFNLGANPPAGSASIANACPNRSTGRKSVGNTFGSLREGKLAPGLKYTRSQTQT
ncbi:MAG: NAD-dependent epimerase/dehydratase family protein [Anaerolineae bacterium]